MARGHLRSTNRMEEALTPASPATRTTRTPRHAPRRRGARRRPPRAAVGQLLPDARRLGLLRPRRDDGRQAARLLLRRRAAVAAEAEEEQQQGERQAQGAAAPRGAAAREGALGDCGGEEEEGLIRSRKSYSRNTHTCTASLRKHWAAIGPGLVLHVELHRRELAERLLRPPGGLVGARDEERRAEALQGPTVARVQLHLVPTDDPSDDSAEGVSACGATPTAPPPAPARRRRQRQRPWRRADKWSRRRHRRMAGSSA